MDRVTTGDAICCLDGFSSEPDGPFIVAGSFVCSGPNGTFLRTVGLYLQRSGTSLVARHESPGRHRDTLPPPATPAVLRASSGAYQFGVGTGTGASAASFDPAGAAFFSVSDLGIDPMTDLAIYAAATAPVPEPATLTLVGAGMLAWAARRYKAKTLQLFDRP